jgi:hypothetical protein
MTPKQATHVAEAAQFFWEEVLSIDEVTEGVYWTKTVAHGGIIVDTSQVKPGFLSKETEQASSGRFGTMLGYEEDCCYALVVREHPELFPWEEYGGAKEIEDMCKACCDKPKRLLSSYLTEEDIPDPDAREVPTLPAYVHCPLCHAIFTTTPELLESTRCSACNQEFDYDDKWEYPG